MNSLGKEEKKGISELDKQTKALIDLAADVFAIVNNLLFLNIF